MLLLLGRIVFSTVKFVGISSSITSSILLVLMSFEMEISFSKHISLGIGGRRSLKNTSISKILVHIPLSVVKKGSSKAKKGFPSITLEDNLSIKKKGVLKLISLLYMVVHKEFS